MFELHSRLQADTRLLGDLPLCRVLLAKDSQYPWLILVPSGQSAGNSPPGTGAATAADGGPARSPP